MRRMATQLRSKYGHSMHDTRVTLERRTQRRAQRTTENPTNIGSEPEFTPASSGWINDSTPRCVFHPSPSRCWWLEGDLAPNEYGNAGAHSSTRPISRGAAARGPRLPNIEIHKTTSVQHDALDSYWHVRPTGFPPTMGRSNASSG